MISRRFDLGLLPSREADLNKRIAVGGLGAFLCLAIGFLGAASPTYAFGGIVIVAILVLAITRLNFAVAVLAGCFFFANYLAKGSGTLTIDKAIGAIAVLAWMVEWTLGKRGLVGAPQFWLIGGILSWLLVSYSNAIDQSVALKFSLRYLIFFVLFFLVLQTIQGRPKTAEMLVTVAVVAATVSAIIGLESFLSGAQSRATGPILDPNDFGFLLATTLPLAIFKARWAKTKREGTFFFICFLLIIACIGATFSRGALVALSASGAWILLSRRVRVRWLFGAIGLAALLFSIVYAFDASIIQGAFVQKAHIANTNTLNRLYLWKIAVREFESQPISGVGPGNFPLALSRFGQSPGNGGGVLTTHNVYFNILAELGLPGELFFLGFIAYSWWDLRKPIRGSLRLNAMQTAIAAGFVAAVVGSMFLTEQYYPPIWFLSALGISISRVRNALAPGADIDFVRNKRRSGRAL